VSGRRRYDDTVLYFTGWRWSGARRKPDLRRTRSGSCFSALPFVEETANLLRV
jgi:hypothetical protein